MVVDAAHVTIRGRPIGGRIVREGIANTGDRGGDFAGDFLVQTDELRRTLADIAC
ncbi:hypothetical protein MAHJHV55_51350 [Mycobacterium avium subsp. hominissuis]